MFQKLLRHLIHWLLPRAGYYIAADHRKSVDAGRVDLKPVVWDAKYLFDPNGSQEKFSDYFANSLVTMNDAKVACIQGFAYEGASVRTKNELMKSLAGIGAERVMFTRVWRKALEDGTVELIPDTKILPVKVKRPAGGSD